MSLNAAVLAAIEEQAKVKDVNEVVKGGGGEYEQPPVGRATATLIGYIEVGIQKREWTDKGKKQSKNEDTALLIWELAGGKYKPKEVEIDGATVLIPYRMTMKLAISQNEKAHYYKVFKMLNYSGQYRIPAQCVGNHYLIHIFGGEREDKTEWRSLKGPNGFLIEAPQVTTLIDPAGDPTDQDNIRVVPVPKPTPISEQRVFLWEFCDKGQWDSLYIDGEYPAKDGKPAVSKNKFQNMIREAQNFAGSPIQKLLGDQALDLSSSPLAGNTDATPSSSDSAPSTVSAGQVNMAGGAADDALADLV